MNTRNKILLALLAPLWGLFSYLTLYREHEEGWWRGFFFATALLVTIIAPCWLLPFVLRLFRKPKYEQSLNRLYRPPQQRALITVSNEEAIADILQQKAIAAERKIRDTHHAPRTTGFTLIELLVVIAIIGLLAALVTPVLSHFRKGDTTLAATRQMLDDVGRARALAISHRTTVYMVFIHTNFWQDPLRPATANNQWTSLQNLAPLIANSPRVSQMYNAQWNGYALYSLQSVGDQPGRHIARDLLTVKTLPQDSFIAPIKFTAPLYRDSAPFAIPFLIQTNFAVYGFHRTNTIPFPTSDALTNANYRNQLLNNSTVVQYPTVAYIAFNYLGQLTDGSQGSPVQAYDEYIPLAHGSIAEPHDAKGNPTNLPPSAIENPPGNSTNISFEIIHIDRLTGRARLENAQNQ